MIISMETINEFHGSERAGRPTRNDKQKKLYIVDSTGQDA